MTARLAPFVASAALLAGVFAMQGGAPFGRVLMALGLPDLAIPLLAAPTERGTALFRAGRYAEAAAAFQTADAPYNHGLAAAWAGDYATALVAWERVLTADPSDAEARANHALVASLLSGTEFQAVPLPPEQNRDGDAVLAQPGQGKARAAGSGDEANAPKTSIWMPEITSDGVRRVPYFFDAQFIAANERWLDTLEDEPGRYLRARLKAEQKAREANGTALAPPEDPR